MIGDPNEELKNNKNFMIALAIAFVLIAAGGLYIIGSSYNKAKQAGNSANNTVDELKVDMLQEGTGEGAEAGDTVSVHYTGTLENGKKFDSSIDRGTPFIFTLGAEQVIKGWDQGLVGMKVGEKRRLTIPSKLGYGESGTPGGEIPPNATLVFEIEMINIEKAVK